MAVAAEPKHTCSECVFFQNENRYCDEWQVAVRDTEPNCPRFMLAEDGGPVTVVRVEPAGATDKPTSAADGERLREDLLQLEQWAVRLDKRIDELQTMIIERLAAIGVRLASLQKSHRTDDGLNPQHVVIDEYYDCDADEIEKMLNAEMLETDDNPSTHIVDKLLGIIEAQHAIIKSQLGGGRCE